MDEITTACTDTANDGFVVSLEEWSNYIRGWIANFFKIGNVCGSQGTTTSGKCYTP